ncbi:SGNH/GDSL hydrolase family protein [Corynebacterium variabile]|uniref:SGNH/GDSL hydrolase family protein n=1 Tax=Corynebacterium variabile TaxID=1727 RepID=UPI00289942B7|nr:SGNH/GDSL hydrolase family protein [Corynebacterium variabile]
MALNVGTLPVAGVYVGDTEVQQVYAGSSLVWENKARTRVDYQWSQAQTAAYRVLFLGSSTTYGYSLAWPEGFSNQMVAHIVSGQIPVPATPLQRSTSSRTAPTAAGFHFHNAAVNGATSINYWGTEQKNLTAAYRPRLVVHMIGSNDYANGMIPSTYRANVERAINEINNRSSGCRHLLVHQFHREDVTNPAYSWESYRDQLRAIAASRTDTDFCDANRILTTELGWNSTYLQSDRVHANWFGNTLLARAVRNYLKLDAHDGELIYGLDAKDITVAKDARIRSWPATAGSKITLPATVGADNNAPIKREYVAGQPYADFYNGALKLATASWAGAVAAPMTMFIVTNSWNDSFGTSQKPLFTRGVTADDGFLWAWRDTSAGKVYAAVGSPDSPGVTVPRATIDAPAVTAITFHPNGWTSLYINAVYGTDMAPQNNDEAMGPWLKSMKLMTNTGESNWGESSVRYFSLIKSCPNVGAEMRRLGTRFGITIKELA